MRASTLLSILGLASSTLAAYVIQDDYEPSSFFSQFDFFTVSVPLLQLVVDFALMRTVG
jgi:uncharacterized membrane protein YhdT